MNDQETVTIQHPGRASLEINFRTSKGQGGFMYIDLSHLHTIDQGDIAHAVRTMEKELTRLQSSRTFTRKDTNQ